MCVCVCVFCGCVVDTPPPCSLFFLFAMQCNACHINHFTPCSDYVLGFFLHKGYEVMELGHDETAKENPFEELPCHVVLYQCYLLMIDRHDESLHGE